MNLIGVYQRIKNSFDSVNRICDNHDSFDVGDIYSLIYTVSYNEEFYFSCYGVYYIMNYLND